MASNRGRTDFYNDLGSGVFFGSMGVTEADQGMQILINLNSAGLTSLNASAGNLWAVGGSIYDAPLLSRNHHNAFVRSWCGIGRASPPQDRLGKL